MPLIPDSTSLKILDRMGAQYAIFREELGDTIVTPENFFFARVTSPDDPDVETNCVDAAKDMDDGFDAQTQMAVFTEANTLISQLEVHVRAMGYSSVDDYLASRDLDVHQDTGDWIRVTGRTLQARNVFKRTQQDLATFDYASPSTINFTAGTALQSTATGLFSDGNYAGVPAEIVVTSAGGTTSGVVTVTGKIEGGSTFTQTVTVSSGSQNDVVATITGKVIRITGVSYGSGLTDTAVFAIRNTIPRSITL